MIETHLRQRFNLIVCDKLNAELGGKALSRGAVYLEACRIW
jgi:hypothetical protein